MTPSEPPRLMPSRDLAYARVAGWAAIAAGIGGVVYSVAFIGGVVLKGAPELGAAVAAIALVMGGILSAIVTGALWDVARRASAPGAAVGLAFAVIGAVGGAAHGAFDLANVLHPPLSDVLAVNELPSPVDPRGFLTFAMAGIGLLVLVCLMRREGELADWLGSLGLVVGALLVVIYLGRLIILSPTNPLVAGLAGVTGIVLSPLFYVALGLRLRSSGG